MFKYPRQYAVSCGFEVVAFLGQGAVDGSGQPVLNYAGGATGTGLQATVHLTFCTIDPRPHGKNMLPFK